MFGLLTRSKVKRRADAVDQQALIVQSKLHDIAHMRTYTPEEWEHVAAARKELIKLRIMLSPMQEKRLPWKDRKHG